MADIVVMMSPSLKKNCAGYLSLALTLILSMNYPYLQLLADSYQLKVLLSKLHQYAHKGIGQRVHSVNQLKSFGLQVHDSPTSLAPDLPALLLQIYILSLYISQMDSLTQICKPLLIPKDLNPTHMYYLHQTQSGHPVTLIRKPILHTLQTLTKPFGPFVLPLSFYIYCSIQHAIVSTSPYLTLVLPTTSTCNQL